jgi:hypothetical protein
VDSERPAEPDGNSENASDAPEADAEPSGEAVTEEPTLNARSADLVDGADPGSTGDAKSRKPPSQASALLRLVEKYEYFHTRDKKAFTTFRTAGRWETHPVKSRAFKLHLQQFYFERQKSAISSKALTDALGVLEGRGLFNGEEHPVYTRVGERDGAIYLDLGDRGWSAIKVTREGWSLVPFHPVKFYRSAGMAPLPIPVAADGTLDRLRGTLNIADQDQFKLLVGWMLGALTPRGPYPLLQFRSEHGSGKSTATRLVRSLIDPNSAPIRAMPKDEPDLLIAASHSWVLAFDNVTKIPEALSDALCRLSTGGGLSTRELYTNEEEVLFEARRPVIINGISDAMTRPDLVDRTISIELRTVHAHERLPEAELWGSFAEIAPGVLAALLDGVVRAIADLDFVDLADLPRMADFCLWVEAAAPALGWQRGDFHKLYSGNREEATVAALEHSPVTRYVLALKDWTTEGWEGTATELLAEIDQRAEAEHKRQDGWPRTARGMSNVIRSLAPALRDVGLDVTFGREAHTRVRGRTIKLKATAAMQANLFGTEREYPD